MSARRLEVVFSAEARADLEEILLFTERRWDVERAAGYADTIQAAIRTLSEFPALGRRRDELAPNVRSHAVGEHVIYYRVTANRLRIRRILHGRRDSVVRGL
jgi:toxin ParE1/3/4